MPSCPKEETQEASSDPEEGTQDKAGSLAGWTDLGGPALPALRKLTINGNFPPKKDITHVESTGASRYGRSSAAKVSTDD